MTCGEFHQQRSRFRGRRDGAARGFTLIELVVVVAIAMIVMAFAIPLVQNSLRYYALRSAVSSLTGAIQSNRYQAIFHGCQYQVAFKAATYDYTVSSKIPAAGGTQCLLGFGAASAAIPLAGRGVALNTDVTIVFHPSGQVNATAGGLGGIQLTYPGLPAEGITVSTYGNITVYP
jgi:prepilin-type N-terminal cleavage/methylation domain-containing protein